MSRHMTETDIVDVIEAYTVRLETMKSIAKRYGITRQGVHKALRKRGVATAKASPKKRRGGVGRVSVSCFACGGQIERWRYHVRKAKHLFCGHECYYAWLEAGNAGGLPYKQNRHGQRIGRQVVSAVFEIPEGAVVHHKDRNTLNNNLENLMVFANQGDLTRHHRDFEALPIFDGSKYLADQAAKRRQVMR